ncbi:MAG: hypothetical protein IJ955_08980 [Oscillospiraceae bacterium]|nr:hypothetical protein [Oscillospiraceae bacterium]
MVGPISSSAAYMSIQRYTPENSPVKKPSVPAAESSFNTELSVSSNAAPRAALSAPSEFSHPASTMDADTYASELFGKMRLSPAAGEEADVSAQMEQMEQITTEEQQAEETQEAEQLSQEQIAEEKRKAYLEALKEQEEERAERIEQMKQAQSEDKDASGTSDEESAQESSGGVVTFDRTAAMLQNYQMGQLMQGMFSAQAKGQDTSVYGTAMDAMRLKNGGQVRFSADVTAHSKMNSLDQRFLLAS